MEIREARRGQDWVGLQGWIRFVGQHDALPTYEGWQCMKNREGHYDGGCILRSLPSRADRTGRTEHVMFIGGRWAGGGGTVMTNPRGRLAGECVGLLERYFPASIDRIEARDHAGRRRDGRMWERQ